MKTTLRVRLPMFHWRATRLLAALPDHTLPDALALAVETHAANCARCQRKREDLDAAEHLLLAMPAHLLPLEWSPVTYRRLDSLAHWTRAPGQPEPGRWRAPALSLASALAILTMALMAGRYSPDFASGIGPVNIAMTQPDFATGTAYSK